MHLFSRGKKPRLDNFVVLLSKKNFHAKNGRKMAYFSLDCRYTPELGTKSAPPGVGQKRGQTNFFSKNETHLKISWASAACLRNFKSIHALVWSERPTEIWQFYFFFAKLVEPNCGAVKLLVKLQIGISQQIMHLYSRIKSLV